MIFANLFVLMSGFSIEELKLKGQDFPIRMPGLSGGLVLLLP
jgi:hypothetical protein